MIAKVFLCILSRPLVHPLLLAYVPPTHGDSMSPLEAGSATVPTVDALAQELLLIQQSGPRRVAIIGTRNLPLTHQQLVEMLSYALVLSGNQVVTSGGANGTNMAVIKGGTRANPARVH